MVWGFLFIGIVLVIMYIRVLIDTFNETKRRKEKARQIEKLKPVTYTTKQLKRMEAIEAIHNETGSYYHVGKLATTDKEFLGFVDINMYSNAWLAIYEDEVLPSKACSERYHIYPVSRKDFSKYYDIYMRIDEKERTEGKFETVVPKASVTKRAVAGAVIGGNVGAVIGAASAIDKNSRGSQRQYVVEHSTERKYFATIRSFFFDNEGKLQFPDHTVWGFETYMEDNETIKRLTPLTGKKMSYNWTENDDRFWYIHQHSTSSFQAEEIQKAFLYLLNEY